MLLLAVAVLAAVPAVSQAATLALAPASPGVHNLLVNPNFDIDLSGWQLSGDVTWTNTPSIRQARTYSNAAGANFQPIFDTQPGLAVCP